jgi:hypothetical protein
MLLLLLHPLSVLSLVIRARDQLSSTPDDVGREADAFRSAVLLLLLQAALDRLAPNCPFPPAHRFHKLALIATMRRMWLLEFAIGAQSPPSPSAFSSGPDREFEFLAARLGLQCSDSVRQDAPNAALLHLAGTVFHVARHSGVASLKLFWPIGLPLQPSLHAPPHCFSDLLVACLKPCRCSTSHRAAVHCL